MTLVVFVNKKIKIRVPEVGTLKREHLSPY
jgi:hypothetical protein